MQVSIALALDLIYFDEKANDSTPYGVSVC